MLKRAIEEGPNPESEYNSLYYVEKAEEMLLTYASQVLNKKHGTNGNVDEEQEALKLKSCIFEGRGHYQSAIFYLKKAQLLAIAADENIVLNEERMIDLLLEAGRHPQANARLTIEAYEKLQKLEGTNAKKKLWLKYYQIEVEKSMGGNENLKVLKDNRLKFEKCEHKIQKRLFDIPNEEEEQESEKNILEVIRETKRVLDKAMNHIKCEIYKNKGPNCYYPTHNTINNESGNTTEEKMQLLIEKKYKFIDFKEKHPILFQFLIDEQSSAHWLQKLIDLRNANEHEKSGKAKKHEKSENSKEHEMNDAMKKHSKEEKVELVRNGSDLASKVWKKIQCYVDNWIETELESDIDKGENNYASMNDLYSQVQEQSVEYVSESNQEDVATGSKPTKSKVTAGGGGGRSRGRGRGRGSKKGS